MSPDNMIGVTIGVVVGSLSTSLIWYYNWKPFLKKQNTYRKLLRSVATPENVCHPVYPKCLCSACAIREVLGLEKP